MSTHCPHCGSCDVKNMEPTYDWYDEDECVCQWDVVCAHCGDTYIVSELLKVTNRIVAKDGDDLKRQLDAEVDLK